MPNQRADVHAHVLCLALLFLPLLLYAQEEEPGDRSGFFVDVGLGLGTYRINDVGEFDFPVDFTIGIESRIGARIDAHFSLFLLSHFNITSFEAVGDFSTWIFAENDLRLLLTVFIPFAVFFESQVFVGPGIVYYTSTHAPSLYIECGLGYSGFQSISRHMFIMGAGLFAGCGVEIVPNLGCGLRVVWAPSVFHSGWTPSDENYLSVMAFFYFL